MRCKRWSSRSDMSADIRIHAGISFWHLCVADFVCVLMPIQHIGTARPLLRALVLFNFDLSQAQWPKLQHHTNARSHYVLRLSRQCTLLLPHPAAAASHFQPLLSRPLNLAGHLPVRADNHAYSYTLSSSNCQRVSWGERPREVRQYTCMAQILCIRGGLGMTL